MQLLKGRRGLVFGVANEHSIAWAIAQAAAAQGAVVALNYQSERLARRVRPLAERIGAAFCGPCDVGDDAALDAFFEQALAQLGGPIDFLVHSVAFAPQSALAGRFLDTTRADWATTFDASVYSLIALCQRAAPHFSPQASVLTLSYLGAQRVVPHYQVMGPAKAALEASVRTLAAELGAQGARVNALSAGPVRSLSARSIPRFSHMLDLNARISPLQRNIEQTEIADAALFLLSDLSRAITGEVLYVDAGLHAMAPVCPEAPPHE